MVILFFFAVILISHRKVRWPTHILLGLSVWAILHMAGGGLSFRGTRLYDLILIPISETYQILKFDQALHIFGFFVATLVVYHLLIPHMKPNYQGWISLSIIVTMAGLGLGALNEIIEFLATILLSSTGVGGYTNTSLDLVADLIGAIIALVFIRMKNSKTPVTRFSNASKKY